MNRPTSELLETFLIRIKENIGKRLESKTKKKKKAKKTPTDDCGSSTETVRAYMKIHCLKNKPYKILYLK